MYKVIGQGVLVDVSVLAIDIVSVKTANTPCYTCVARLSLACKGGARNFRKI